VSSYASVGLLCVMGCILFFLPLIPAFRELRRKSDAEPLVVVQQHAGEIRFFADSFRSYLKSLGPTLEQCSRTGATASGTMPDGTEYIVYGQGDQGLLLPPSKEDQAVAAIIASATDLALPWQTTFSRDIYSAGDFFGGEKNNYRAVLAEKDVRLGEHSSVNRWVHAVGEFSADAGCKLFGRASSDRSIRLTTDCTFSRLNAPRIATFDSDSATAPATEDTTYADESSAVLPRTLHDGDLEIPPGQVLRGNLVVRGKLRVGTGARIEGSVKSEKELVLESNVRVEGSLISTSKIVIGADCRIHGPIIAERAMRIASGTRCGSQAKPTTLSAPEIELETGVLVSGTLWARERGQVVRAL